MRIFLFPGIGEISPIFLNPIKTSLFFSHGVTTLKYNSKETFRTTLINLYSTIKSELNDTTQCIFIGHSFGGLLALTLSIYFNVKKLICINTPINNLIFKNLSDYFKTYIDNQIPLIKEMSNIQTYIKTVIVKKNKFSYIYFIQLYTFIKFRYFNFYR